MWEKQADRMLSGVVAAVTEDDFMISLKACSNQVQDLPWSEMREPVARAAKSWPRITLTFAVSIFCTPQEKTSVRREFLECVRAFPPPFKQ
jgi:hypothetical protein